MTQITNTAADPTHGATPTGVPDPAPQPAPAAAAQASGPAPADLRLVIEDDQAAGCFVYKTIDWRTGEVVQQLPREQVLQLREALNYAAGKLLATKA